MDKYHLKKDGETWGLFPEGSKRPVVRQETKADTLSDSMKFMNENGGSMKIHKENGRIQEERTYPGSADPPQSPG